MNTDTFRVKEIERIVHEVTSRDDATDVDAWHALGRIDAVLTTSDREVLALTALG